MCKPCRLETGGARRRSDAVRCRSRQSSPWRIRASFAQQGAPNVAAANPQAPAKSLGERAKESAGGAVEKLDDLVKRAADIFKRVPCATKGVYLEGSLPNVARKLAANQPVTIVAFGSSSTVGYGATSPIFSYPYRLADQLRRKFPAGRHHGAQPRHRRRGYAGR